MLAIGTYKNPKELFYFRKFKKKETFLLNYMWAYLMYEDFRFPKTLEIPYRCVLQY